MIGMNLERCVESIVKGIVDLDSVTMVLSSDACQNLSDWAKEVESYRRWDFDRMECLYVFSSLMARDLIFSFPHDSLVTWIDVELFNITWERGVVSLRSNR